MTFDALQTLIFFGTKPLEENDRIFRSSNSDIDAIIQRGKSVYGQTALHRYAGYDRGFYFQPVLIECDFRDYFETLAQEPSLILVRGMQGMKTLEGLDGSYTLPFFPFHILVNRTLFSPQRPREDENIWLNNLTERRRAIAHELLYAKQYAELYDNESDSLTQNVSNPTSSEEDELMCPMTVLEQTLNTFEIEHQLHFLTPGNFVDADPNSLKPYYRFWLIHYAVSERLCFEQTLNYLQTGIRNHVRTNALELKRRISLIIDRPDPKSEHFHSCLQNGHPHSFALNALCSEVGRPFNVSPATTIAAIAHALNITHGNGI